MNILPKSKRHAYNYRICYSDCDPAQIVFFANYFRWFDTATREFFTFCGIPSWHEAERDRGIIGAPLVNVQADFKSPATYGEDIVITTHIEKWNKSSFVVNHIARKGECILAEGRETRVFAIRDSENSLHIKSIRIPEDFMRAWCQEGHD